LRFSSQRARTNEIIMSNSDAFIYMLVKSLVVED